MFLMQRGPRVNGDGGGALIAVIGIVAVVTVVGAAMIGVVINSISMTGSTRAGVQSQAAAESGIDYATGRLESGECHETFVHANVPSFRATVQYSLSSTGDLWVSQCPIPAAAVRIRIVSQGSPSGGDVAGGTHSDVRVIETIHAAAPPPPPLVASGAALYSYRSTGVGTTGRLVSVAGSRPSLLVAHGDVDCGTSGEVGGDVVVARGAFIAGTSCAIGGNVWSAQAATLGTSFTMPGNVVASSVSMGSNSRVDGAVWSSGRSSLDTSARVGGGLVAGSLEMGPSSVISGDAWVTGAAALGTGSQVGGSLSAVSKSGAGTVAGGTTLSEVPAPGPSPEPAPLVPEWVDFSYQKADWRGFTETEITGTCDLDKLQTVTTRMTGAAVIDARACTNGVTLATSAVLSVPYDLVIVANRIDVGTSAGFTSTSSRKLWLITPDGNPDGQPTCPAGGSVDIGTSAIIGTEVTALVYTPCSMSAGASATWRGQVHAAKAAFSASSTLYFTPVGLPGVDLTTGAAHAASGTGLLGSLVSMRELGTS